MNSDPFLVGVDTAFRTRTHRPRRPSGRRTPSRPPSKAFRARRLEPVEPYSPDGEKTDAPRAAPLAFPRTTHRADHRAGWRPGAARLM